MPRKDNVELMLLEVIQQHVAKRGPQDTAEVLAQRLVDLVAASGNKGAKLNVRHGAAVVIVDNEPEQDWFAQTLTVH